MRNPHNEPLTSDIQSAAAGVPEKEAQPERKCVLTGRHDARGALVRLAISSDGQVMPDALARAPGRGACARFGRALRGSPAESTRGRSPAQQNGKPPPQQQEEARRQHSRSRSRQGERVSSPRVSDIRVPRG